MVNLSASSITSGLLIDSERIYTEVTNSILEAHGKGPLPVEIKAQLMGTTSRKSETNLRTTRTTCITLGVVANVGIEGITSLGGNRYDTPRVIRKVKRTSGTPPTTNDGLNVGKALANS